MNRLTYGRIYDYFVVVRGIFNLIRSLGIPRVQFTAFKESFKMAYLIIVPCTLNNNC